MADANKETDPQRGSGSKAQGQIRPMQPHSRTLEPYRQNQALASAASPFSLMRRLMGDMDRLFGGFGSSWHSLDLDDQFERSFWAPQIDVLERDQQLVVHADLPGLRQEDVKVNVDQGVLTISGQRTQEQERSQQGGVHHRERSFGSFQRSIALPEGTDTNQIRASFENGVLEVTAPIPEQARQKGRDIPIGPKAGSGPKH